eukprot:TRINITY_DN44463_c0_g1_i3.p1 TRINITY_DN44463_c0_g1~~TRINITY_DN44463_c0_g1_i3.p1  ORF type:complete len:161 (+),score=19.37 TRINITY_DN44463_c0_g1_i3:248-730(+)
MRQIGGPAPHGGTTANFSALIVWPWKVIVGATCNPGLVNAGLVMDGWWTIQNYSRILPPAPSNGSQAQVLLFNLETDESEHFDLAAQHPNLVTQLTNRISGYWASEAHGFRRSQLNLPLKLGNPRYHNWTWAPFLPSIRHSKYWRKPAGEAEGRFVESTV